jgi:hypothetical protein
MQIRTYGFEWGSDAPVPMAAFCDHLQSASGSRTGDEIVAVSKSGDWVTGLLLSIRDATAYCRMQEEGRRFHVSPQQLETGTSIVDFNFFLVYPATGRGLYQYYYRSMSLRGFGFFCDRRFRDLKKELLQSKVQGQVLDATAQIAIRNEYKDFLHTSYLLKPKTFKQYVRALKRIDFLDCDFVTYRPADRLFIPLADHAKKQKVYFKFNPNSDMNELREQIAKIAEEERFQDAVVSGFDNEERRQTYKLWKNTEIFAEHEYDDLVSAVDIDSDDLKGSIDRSPIVSSLIKVANDKEVAALLKTPKK